MKTYGRLIFAMVAAAMAGQTRMPEHLLTDPGCKLDASKPMTIFGRPSKRQQRRKRHAN